MDEVWFGPATLGLAVADAKSVDRWQQCVRQRVRTARLSTTRSDVQITQEGPARRPAPLAFSNQLRMCKLLPIVLQIFGSGHEVELYKGHSASGSDLLTRDAPCVIGKEEVA